MSLNPQHVLTARTLRITFTNTSGTIADPTAVYLHVSKPTVDEDGATTYAETTYSYGAAEITKNSTGIYQKILTPTEDEYGLWTYEWQGTGTVAWYGGNSFKVLPRKVDP